MEKIKQPLTAVSRASCMTLKIQETDKSKRDRVSGMQRRVNLAY